MYSAQHHEIVDTGWVSFRAEQERKRQTDALMLVAFLRAPQDLNKWRANRAHVEETPVISFEAWRRNRAPVLPAPRHTGAIRPVSAPLPSASEPVRPVQLIERAQLEKTTLHEGEDEMPAWARPEPEHLGAVPSRPLAPQGVEDDAAWLNSVARVQVWAEPEPAQTTGALDALAILAAQKPDDHTVPVLEAIRKKHTKESE